VVKGVDPNETRHQTDTKLRAERGRADEELLERSIALKEDAEEVVRRARERARAVLELARRREDDALDVAHAGSEAKAQIAQERDLADEVIRTEHVEADAALSDERAHRQRALLQLLALERDETDRVLAAERAISDRLVSTRDDLLGVVSHDLRTHLHALLMRAAVIIEGHSDDADLVLQADWMQRSVAQMDKLVTDLLDVATLDSGRIRIESASTDLVSVLADEIEVHTPAAEARRIRLTFEVHERPIMVEVDAARMSRVFMNLLANAIKFTPRGGCIEVSVGRDGDSAEVAVKDTGPGIAPDKLETVFERFRQVGREPRGYGLGLYIARTIVTAHHGRIWVESTLGQGSTFRVRLPVRK
jgi:signal transduction histidine kinase